MTQAIYRTVSQAMERASHGQNRSLLRAAALLDALNVAGKPVGVRELARRLGMPSSTVHRLLLALESIGLVQRQGPPGSYALGYKALQWGSGYLRQIDLRRYALPYMSRLREVTGETVGLSVRVGRTRIYLEQLESPHDIRMTVEVGRPYPLVAGAPGKLLLAYAPEEVVTELLREADRNGVLREELAAIRSSGYGLAGGEVVPGSCTVAVPIRDHTGSVAAALSISGPDSRWTRERAMQELPRLQQAAAEISRMLGYVPQSASAASHAGSASPCPTERSEGITSDEPGPF